MKSLREYISEKSNKTFDKISTQWMIDHYAEYNKEYFNDELPDAKYVDIQYTFDKNVMKETMLGCQGFHKTWWYDLGRGENGMYYMLDKKYNPIKNFLDLEPYIYLNMNIPMTLEKFEDTLIHEMVHLWTHKDGLTPKQGHGKEFKRKCNEIRKIAKERYNKNYELSTFAYDTNMFDKAEIIRLQIKDKLKRNIVGMYFEFDGTKVKNQNKIFTFCTRNVSKKFIDYVIRYYKKYNPKIYITENTYEKLCIELNCIFGTFTSFKFYKLWRYTNVEQEFIMDTLTKTNEIITAMNESKNDYDNKKYDNFEKNDEEKDMKYIYMIPANTDLSDFDIDRDAIRIPQSYDNKIE